MRATALVVGLCLGSQLACGDAVRIQPKPAHPKPKVVDLDFTEDGDKDAPTAASQSGPGSRGWVLWALGATAVAGGIGWYWHEEQSKPSSVKHNEQVFTDEP